MNWQSLIKETSWGSDGELGIEILIGGTKLPDLKSLGDNHPFDKALYRIAYDAKSRIKNELIAYMMANNPEEQDRAKAQKENLLALFDSPIYVEEIPNGYCSDGCCRHLPWFIVTTKHGRVTVGWRKRVINIDWSTLDKRQCADTLFPNENVTKGEDSIHAYGYEKAKEYLNKILNA